MRAVRAALRRRAARRRRGAGGGPLGALDVRLAGRGGRADGRARIWRSACASSIPSRSSTGSSTGPTPATRALPPAFYELKSTGNGRGVYSFCMCPGGWIVPAATEPEGVVVNGMSLSRRDSPFANSGLVVEVRAGRLRGRRRGRAGRGGLPAPHRGGRLPARAAAAFRAPAQRLTDFLAGTASSSLPATSYRPGTVGVALEQVFPPLVVEALRVGLAGPGPAASRVPAPRRRPGGGRDPHQRARAHPARSRRPTLRPGWPACYPVGEGAGYAGGIVSAALDGSRAAAALLCARG